MEHGTEVAIHSTTMTKQCKRSSKLTFIILVSVGLMKISLLTQQMSYPRRNLTIKTLSKIQRATVPPYTQRDIQSLLYNVGDPELMLLVFNGNKFQAYALGHWTLSFRYVKLIPLMVHALRTNHPQRFQPDKPVFQLVFSVADSIRTICANHPDRCPFAKLYPPIVSFPTAYRDDDVLPTAKAFPNPVFGGCIYDRIVKRRPECKWQAVDQSLKFEELRNQLIWRGSDYSVLSWMDEYRYMNTDWMKRDFTDDALAAMTPKDAIDKIMNRFWFLTPRWKVVALTLKESITSNDIKNLSWINALFTGDPEAELHSRFEKAGISVLDNQSMDTVTMSKYKYQIDLAGGKLE